MNFLIVDDHPIVRLGVRQLIESHWLGARVDEAETSEKALELARVLPLDAIVLDLMMPDTTGIEGAVRMLRVARQTPILVLSSNAETAYASRLLEMGIAGYLPKDRASDELTVALRRVLEGKRYVTPSMADHLVDMIGGRASKALPHELLSAQEHRVMQLMASGSTPAKIAEIMRLSVKTVGTYRARLLEKTGWKNNVELTKYCVQHSLTDES